MHNTLMLSTFVASSLLSRNAYAFRSAQLQSFPVYRQSRLYGSSDSIKDGGNSDSIKDGKRCDRSTENDSTSTSQQAWQTNPRSKWSTRKHRKRIKAEEELRKQKNGGEGLSWETFDFGER